jgi:hypothetical protein
MAAINTLVYMVSFFTTHLALVSTLTLVIPGKQDVLPTRPLTLLLILILVKDGQVEVDASSVVPVWEILRKGWLLFSSQTLFS